MANDIDNVRVPISTWDFEFPEHPLPSVSDFQDFLDGAHSLSSEEGPPRENGDEDGDAAEESKRFWNSQHEVFQGTLCRSNSIEMRIRNSTREALREIEAAGSSCPCGRTTSDCRSCLIQEVCGRLLGSGYDVGICKSKWRSSSCIPSGELTFLNVVDNSSSKRGEMRVIIELNFRAEFEMARAYEQYNLLLRRLPEVFVGKVERLKGVTKVICSAAERCMKEKGMHMGPWRKHRYMQAKWLGSCQRTVPVPAPASACLPIELTRPLRRPSASMLTMDLLENLPPLVHCTAVAVV